MIAIIVVTLVLVGIAAFVWGLCRMAALQDEMYDDTWDEETFEDSLDDGETFR